ncbi:hypothetical protein HK104_006519 [Borealophlyctis nickersoniae]|nr:hypothetical protein HK104_006519 [Borealophlyctis nickersoniae]
MSQAIGCTISEYGSDIEFEEDMPEIVSFDVFRLQGLHIDFARVLLPRAWFVEFLEDYIPRHQIVYEKYPEQPLYLCNKDEREKVLQWFNSFRVYQRKVLVDEFSKNSE